MIYQFTEIPLTLFSNTEVLPNCIASCRVVLVLSSHLNGVECIINVIFKVRHFQYGPL